MSIRSPSPKATLFLDNGLCIKRYTNRAEQVVRVIPTDSGRPLLDLTSKLQHVDLVADAAEVLESLKFREREVLTDEGHWLLLGILPYRTFENRIEGLVMTFVDIDEMKQIQIEAEQAKTCAEEIVLAVREPLLVLCSDLRVRSANRAFVALLG